MAELKTRPSGKSVRRFLDAIGDDRMRENARTVYRMMRRITRKNAKLWGPSIVGFGSYHYRYASGREGDWPLTGFSPRKQNLTIYIMDGFERHTALMRKLGPHKTGRSCLYLRDLEEVNMDVLEQIVRRSVERMARKR